MVNPLLQHRYMLCPDVGTLRNCIISSSSHILTFQKPEPGQQHPHPPTIQTMFLAFLLLLLCSSIVFQQAPILLQQQEISFQPIWFMYAGSGASAQRRRNPLVAAGRLNDYAARQRFGSWNLLIRLHQSSPVGCLRNAAKSMLSILSWHFTKTEATENVWCFSYGKDKQKLNFSDCSFYFFLFYSGWASQSIWLVWHEFELLSFCLHLVKKKNSFFFFFCEADSNSRGRPSALPSWGEKDI